MLRELPRCSWAPQWPRKAPGPDPGTTQVSPSVAHTWQDFLAFLSNLWVDTTQLVTTALGDTRFQELRAEGEAMDKIAGLRLRAQPTSTNTSPPLATRSDEHRAGRLRSSL